MDRARIILLNCGEEVYPQNRLAEMIEEVRQGVRALDVELVSSHIVMNEKMAVEALKAIRGSEFDAIVVHLVSWHITSNVLQVLKEYKAVPVLVWATGGKTDSSGKLHSPAAQAGITALLPALREMGYKFKAIYEKPDEAHRFSDVESFAKVARAYRRIRGSRIGLVGYADMGLYTCTYDRTSLAAKLGIDVEDYFSYDIGKLMEEVPEEDIRRITDGMKRDLVFENEVSEKVLDKVACLYHVLKHRAGERGLDAISIKCVYGVTRYMGVNPCMAQSLLANRDLSVICECDAHGLITNMMLSMLTGQTSAFMENYEFYEDEILVGTCGFLPFDFAEKPVKVRSANLGDFFVGLSNVSQVKTGMVTFARLYKTGDSYRMFLSKGEARPPVKWIELGWEEPTPDFPSMLLKLSMPVQEYLEKVPGQHIICVYGDHVEQMKDLCRLLDIEVVL